LDALAYTREVLEDQFNLLQLHLEQFPYMTKNREFCLDCIRKHFSTIRGLGDEGMSFVKSRDELKLYSDLANWANRWRRNLPKTDEEADKALKESRSMRKDVILSPMLTRVHANLEGGPPMRIFMHSKDLGPLEKPISLLGAPKGEGKMSVTLEKAGVSLGYGALDVGLMAVDEARQYAKSFRNITDWSRLFAFVGSTIVSLLRPKGVADRVLDDVEVLFYASGPKLEESFYDLAKTEGRTVTAKLKEVFQKAPATPPATTTTTPTTPAALTGRAVVAPQLR